MSREHEPRGADGIEPFDRSELPLELARAFGAYRTLEPDAEARAALLQAVTVTSAARSLSWARRGLYLVVLGALGGLLLTTIARPSAPRVHSAPIAVPNRSTSSVEPVVPTEVALQNTSDAPAEEPASSVTPSTGRSVRVGSRADAPRRSTNAAGPRAASRPSTAPVPRAVPANAVAQELALLVRAKQVMAGDPLLALALSDEHRQRFAHGAFAEEREVLAIEALMRAGDVTAAQQRAAAFRAAYPRSAHLDRLHVVLREP